MGKVVPFFAKLCPFLRGQVKRAKSHYIGIFRHRREFRVHDQNTIYLPRHYEHLFLNTRINWAYNQTCVRK